MTLRTPRNPMPLLAILGLLAGCDSPSHDLEVEATVALTDEALAAVESHPAAVVVGLHVVPEDRGSDFEIGWEAIGLLEDPDDVPASVTGVIDAAFGPCFPGEAGVIAKIAPAYEDPQGELDWSLTPFVEAVVDGAIALDERCSSGAHEVDVAL